MDATTTVLLNLCSLTCRICLQNHYSSNSLYDATTSEPPMKLCDLLQRVAQVEIATDDLNTPTRICQFCTDKLLAAFEFVSAITKSESMLHDYLQELNLRQSEQPLTEEEIQVDAHSNIDEYEEEQSQEVEVLDDECDIHMPFEQIEETVPEVKCEGAEVVESQSKKSYIESHPRNISTINVVDENSYRRHRPSIGSRLSCYRGDDWHKCVQCTRSFAKETTLRRHIQTVHRQVPPEQIAAKAPKPTIEHPIPCGYCPRIFARKDTLQRHMRALHPNELKNDNVTVSTVKQEQKVDDENAVETIRLADATTPPKKKHTYKRGLCPHCGESFSHASLIIHIRRHTGEKPYQCNSCEKGFPRRQDLVIHQRQHTGERPHICTVCGKSFIRPNKLARHMRIHTGQRPYKCETCGKAFSQSNDLKIHTRRHTGEKPYKCGVCGECFICGTALNTHRKAKVHFEPEGSNIMDPYAKIRVNNRKQSNKVEPCLSDMKNEIIVVPNASVVN